MPATRNDWPSRPWPPALEDEDEDEEEVLSLVGDVCGRRRNGAVVEVLRRGQLSGCVVVVEGVDSCAERAGCTGGAKVAMAVRRAAAADAARRLRRGCGCDDGVAEAVGMGL